MKSPNKHPICNSFSEQEERKVERLHGKEEPEMDPKEVQDLKGSRKTGRLSWGLGWHNWSGKWKAGKPDKPGVGIQRSK